MMKLQLSLIMLAALAIAEDEETTEAPAEPEKPSVWNNWLGNPVGEG